MSTALAFVEFVGDNFEGEAGCNRTLDSNRRSVCLAWVFQLGFGESFKGTLCEGFKRFAWLGRLGPHKKRRGAGSVAAGVLFCVDCDDAGSKAGVADVEVRAWFGDERFSAESAGNLIAAGSSLWIPGLSCGVGGGKATWLDFVAGYLFVMLDSKSSPGLLPTAWQFLATIVLYPFAQRLIDRFEDADVRFR